MYLFGPNQPSKVLNYRPALHDSEGLSIHAGNGEWIWRPLNNPKHLSVSNFSVESPRGFGLMQRQRAFSDYEDLDDNYQKRPSAWIEPKGDWGKAPSTWSKSRLPTRPTTISWRSGARKSCLNPESRSSTTTVCTSPSMNPGSRPLTWAGSSRPCAHG